MKYTLLSMTIAGLFAGVTLTTGAAAATFSDRASFDAAVVNMTTLDFDGLIGTPEFPNNYPWGTGYMAYSVTLQGVRFSDVYSDSSGGLDYVYILTNDLTESAADAKGTLNDTTTVWLGRSSSRITLPAGMIAFGTDYGIPINNYLSLPMGETVSIGATFHFRDGNASETFALPVTGKSQFFGFTGAEIDYIDLAYAPNHYMVFDNISIAQAVPEPETYALLLAGLGLVGFAARRRKQT